MTTESALSARVSRRRRTILRALATGVAALLASAVSAHADVILLDSRLIASASIYVPGDFPIDRYSERVELARGTATASLDYTDWFGDLRATAIAVQDGSGLSALSILANVPTAPRFRLPTESDTFVQYELTVQNTGSTPVPLSLPFNIFPGEVGSYDPVPDVPADQTVSAHFFINSTRWVDTEFRSEVWDWFVGTDARVDHPIGGGRDPQGLGSPAMRFTTSPPGRTILAWDPFHATLTFADLAPSATFTLQYSIELFGHDGRARAGTSYFGTAGDPFALEQGDSSGGGSLFVLRAGDQVFPSDSRTVPEPSMLATFGLALIGTLARAWWKRELSNS